jgi:2',3'-cyclic-nucleotide 2'-phosphodiesterase (5'-nucleotidase family)
MPTVELLHWNDVHARFAGLARLSARARAIRASSPHPVLLLDGGDVEDTSVRLSAMTFGVAGWRLLGAAGVDAAVAGNGGLLRYGPGLLPRYAAALGSRPLVCDLEDASGATPAGAAASTLLRAGDVGVGVIGITDYYGQYDGYGLRERGRTTAVRREADALRAAGADVVVLLSHAGLNHDRGLSWSLRGKVDLVVGGHTHHLLEEGDRTEGLPIAQAGCHAEHLGRVLLEVSSDGVRVASMSLERVPEEAPGDPAVLAELATCERDLATWLAEPVGHLPEPAPHTDSPDNPAARLVARALHHHAPADLAVLIGGHLTGGLPAGTVTREHVWSATSSPGNLATATLSGAEVRRMFARGLSEEFATQAPRAFRGRRYGYLHYVGASVQGGQVFVGDRPLDDTRHYRVTASDLELSPYSTLLDAEPADRVVHVPTILPELLESYLSRSR